MSKALCVLVCLALVLALAVPAFAETGQDAAQASAGQAAPAGNGGTQAAESGSGGGSGGTIGGIPVVSPEHFAGKLNQLGDTLYKTASPVADMIAKLSLAGSGLLLVLLLVLGAGILRRVVGALFAVCLGLTLWYGAPYLVEMIKYLAVWLQS